MVNNSQKSLHCPNCHRADAVQKVTSVIRGGTTTGTFNGHHISGYYNFGDNSISVGGGGISGSTSSSSNLVESLAPPVLKEAPKQGFLIIGFVVLFFIAFMFLITGFTTDINSFYGFVVFGLFGAILFWIFKSRDSDYEAYLKMWGPKYEKAIEKWNNLYYCHRCDGVFVKGKPLSSIENMFDYLYSDNSSKKTNYPCPFCQSSVRSDAILCPTCGKELYYDTNTVK